MNITVVETKSVVHGSSFSVKLGTEFLRELSVCSNGSYAAGTSNKRWTIRRFSSAIKATKAAERALKRNEEYASGTPWLTTKH